MKQAHEEAGKARKDRGKARKEREKERVRGTLALEQQREKDNTFEYEEKER